MKMNKNPYTTPEIKIFSVSFESHICGLSDNDPMHTVPGGSLDD